MSDRTLIALDPAGRTWPGVGEYGIVPRTSIIPNPLNPRKDFPEQELESLAASMRVLGQCEIGTVRLLTTEEQEANPGARYMLISGERRWRAAEIAGLDTYEIRVRAYANLAEEVRSMFLLNEDRQPISDLENALCMREAITLFGWRTQEETAAGLSKDVCWVSQMHSILRCTPAVQARMHPRVPEERRLGRHVAVIMCKLDPPKQDEVLADMPDELTTTVSRVAWLRRRLSQEGIQLPKRERKPQSQRRMAQVLAQAVTSKSRELLEAGTIGRMFENTSQAEADSLVADLSAALGDFAALVDEVTRLSYGERPVTVLVPREKMPPRLVPPARREPAPLATPPRTPERLAELSLLSARHDTASPMAIGLKDGARLRVEFWDPRARRMMEAQVGKDQYLELWAEKRLSFQMNKKPKPRNYPEPSELE